MITFKHNSWEKNFVIVPHKISVLAVEQSHLLWKYCRNLIGQAEGEIGDFCVSKDYMEIAFDKMCSVEINLAGLELNTKKLQTALVKRCAEEAVGSPESEEKFRKISLELYNFCKNICQDTGYSVELSEEIDTSALFKLFSISFKEEFDSILDMLVEYVNINIEFTGARIFIFLFLTKLLTFEELKKFFKHCEFQGISLLMLEEELPEYLVKNDIPYQGLIIDKDECEISINFQDN